MELYDPQGRRLYLTADERAAFLEAAKDAPREVRTFCLVLAYKHGELRLHTDYVRGRSMKTEVTIRGDGTVTLTTWGRGESALRWLDDLQGKKRIAPVPVPD